MYIARKLKKENIAEYLLYMWQVENLLRAFQLDMDKVNNGIVSQYPVQNESERKELYEWYESLIEMMRTENVQENGHLQINTNIIIDLNDLHTRVLKSAKINDYNISFYRILPLLNQLRLKSESGLSDIELCFNFQFGYMMLKMKKTEITGQTEHSQKEISLFMQIMSRTYKMYNAGEIDLEE